MDKRYFKGNMVILALMLLFDILYMFNGKLLFKGYASILFLVAGVVNFTYCIENKASLNYPKWMVGALLCSMIADIVLNLNFYLGVVIFALAHVFYFISYSRLHKMNRRDFVCGAMIFLFTLAIINFTPFLNFGSSFMKGICSVYALIISLMVGKAISNAIEENTITNKMIAIGSILFLISDMMLMLNKFGNVPGTSYLCLGTYYPAQFILAFSMFKFAKEEHKVKTLAYNINSKLSKIS